MERVVSATEARVHFGELIRRVAEDEEPVVVERGGKPQVVLLSLPQYERLLAGQKPEPDWWSALRRTHDLIRAELGDRELPPAEDTIREMREERDAQLDAAIGHLRRRKSGRSTRTAR
jgi:prevent-host-death family protein